MLRVTLRSLLARKLRLLLASFAIVLGISFVSGAFVLTDSLSRVFDTLFSSTNQGTSVTVQGASALEQEFGSDDRAPIPHALVAKVAAVDGVDEVLPQVGGIATLILPNGKPLVKNGPPVLGFGLTPTSKQASLEVKRGVGPKGPDQLAIDTFTADKQKLVIGDKVSVIGKTERRAMTVVGFIGFKGAATPAGATLLGFNPLTAQQLVGTPGAWTRLSIAAEPGVSQTVLRDRVAAVLPKGLEAQTVEETVAQESADLKEGLGFFNTFLLAFAGISLFVGAFLIFNTFSMLVAQRTRELALMRALGASRKQVTRSVLVEALAVGLFSSLIGFVLGIGVALGLRGVLNAIGLELPPGETVVALRTFVVCLLVGVGITAVAALVPARRAAKVSPVQAMRESTPAEDRSLARRTSMGALVLALGVTALAVGLNKGSIQLVGLGAALSFLGVTILSPLFARPVAGVLGLPFARFGIPGRLGRGNAMRNPRRTSATAAALMIGLALVAMVSTLGSSVKSSVQKTVDASLGADYVLHAQQYMPFTPAAAAPLYGRPELAAVAAIHTGRAKIGKAGLSSIEGIEPKALQAVLRLSVVKGDLDRLAGGEIAVSETEATNLGKSVGDTVPVTWSKTGLTQLTIGAVYEDNDFAGGYVVSEKTFLANVEDKQLTLIAVKAAANASPASSRAAIEKGLKPYPHIEIEDQAEFVKQQGNEINTLLNIIYGLLALSVIIAVLGIINTLALSVLERTRELGLLRAVGLQRRQLRRMIRAESVVIALYGALLGIVVGLAFGWALVQSLKDDGITEFAVPITPIVVVFLLAGVAGVVAAALPARRAARLNVLEAVAST